MHGEQKIKMYYTGLATLGEDPSITPGIEKAVRQCLRQLELLQTVWRNVLPVTVYCKALGEIILQQCIYVCCYFRKQNH
jgi:centromere/kinetochore protein ZW10